MALFMCIVMGLAPLTAAAAGAALRVLDAMGLLTTRLGAVSACGRPAERVRRHGGLRFVVSSRRSQAVERPAAGAFLAAARRGMLSRHRGPATGAAQPQICSTIDFLMREASVTRLQFTMAWPLMARASTT